METEAILPDNLLCFLVWDFMGWSGSFFMSGDSAKGKSESPSVYTPQASIILTTHLVTIHRLLPPHCMLDALWGKILQGRNGGRGREVGLVCNLI